MTSNPSCWSFLTSSPGARWAGLARALVVGSILAVLGLAASPLVVTSSAQAEELSCFKRLGRDGNYLICCPRYFPSPDCIAIKLPSTLARAQSGEFPKPGQKPLIVPMLRRIGGAGIAPGDTCPGGGTAKCTAKCTLGPPPKCEYVEPCTCTLTNASSFTRAFLVRNPNTTTKPPRDPTKGTNILEGGLGLPGAAPSPTGTPAGGGRTPPPPGGGGGLR